jgi:hypothetical protein
MRGCLRAYGERLQDVEKIIVFHFSSFLSDEEKMLFERCRQLRNKILHCDFHSVRETLEALGANPDHGDVKKITISGLSGTQMAHKMRRVVENVPGTFEYVSDLATGAGTVFGWLFEVGVAGNFVQAVESFSRAAGIVERLAVTWRFPVPIVAEI